MSEKNKKISEQNREDEVLQRALLWIGGAALLILFLLFLNRYYIQYRTTEIMFAAGLAKVLPILFWVGLVGCVGLGLMGRAAHKQGKSAKWLCAGGVLCVGAALCAGLTWRFGATAVQFLCGFILAVAVLALVYYLFQREFFVISLCCAVGIIGLWLFRRAEGSAHTVLLYAYLLGVAVLLVAVVLGVRTLQKNGGMWKQWRILSKKAAYSMVYVTCGVVAAILVAALLLGASMAYYLILPAVGWLVIMAVYFTVKLM